MKITAQKNCKSIFGINVDKAGTGEGNITSEVDTMHSKRNSSFYENTENKITTEIEEYSVPPGVKNKQELKQSLSLPNTWTIFRSISSIEHGYIGICDIIKAMAENLNDDTSKGELNEASRILDSVIKEKSMIFNLSYFDLCRFITVIFMKSLNILS